MINLPIILILESSNDASVTQSTIAQLRKLIPTLDDSLIVIVVTESNDAMVTRRPLKLEVQGSKLGGSTPLSHWSLRTLYL